MAQTRYKTNWRRLGLAYVIGSMIAGGVFSIGFVIFATASDIAKTGTWPIWDFQEFGALLGLWTLVSMAWFIGQAFLAALPWLWLHKTGRRHWKYSVALGAFLVPVTTAFLGLNIVWGYFWFALWGGLMGWIIWRIAYAKVDTPPMP